MPMWEIEKVKKFSEGSESKWSAWQNWEEEMIKKTVIKRHFKTLVSNSEISEVVEALRLVISSISRFVSRSAEYHS